jgi:hypothetical protein
MRCLIFFWSGTIHSIVWLEKKMVMKGDQVQNLNFHICQISRLSRERVGICMRGPALSSLQVILGFASHGARCLLLLSLPIEHDERAPVCPKDLSTWHLFMWTDTTVAGIGSSTLQFSLSSQLRRLYFKSTHSNNNSLAFLYLLMKFSSN